MQRLYIIATPIGNLEDSSDRAKKTLASVSYILAEDTRSIKKLLSAYGIKNRVVAWHQHSTAADWSRVKKLFLEGGDIAYVTDAGTPGVSDPGGKLIELVTKEIPAAVIVPIPGPSALTAALAVAGIPMDEFLFLGFLPHKKGRQTHLRTIAESPRPVVAFESVHRIRKLLVELAELSKRVVVCRELTKVFETIYRGTAAEVLERLPAEEMKGEFVVIIY